jgi:putative peptidoglycan lipid II flippase
MTSPQHSVADFLDAPPSLWLLWLVGYLYAFTLAVVLQKLVMPIMPSLHVEYGLMSHDAIVFHNIAVSMANAISSSGWSEWRLMPGSGATANVGILAAIYATLGTDPIWFIPLNAGFHALGAVLLLRFGPLLLPGKGGWIAGSLAALLFLIFPSALVWYGQNHKDSFLIVGFLLILYVFVRSVIGRSLVPTLIDFISLSFGCMLVAIMRPHMLLIYTMACATVYLLTVLAQSIQRIFVWSFISRGAMILVVMVTATWIVEKPNGPIKKSLIIEMNDAHAERVNKEGWHWDRSGILPDAIDLKLEHVSFVRRYFIESGRSIGAGSEIDGDIAPTNAWQLATYLPRALWVGLFAPFPESWFERPNVPRLIGALETLIFYVLALGIPILIRGRPSLPLLVCCGVSAFVLTVLAYTSPNVGTLHRIRYGPLFIVMVIGVCGWVLLFKKAMTYVVGAAWDLKLGGDEKSNFPEASSHANIEDRIGGKRAIGASVLVTLIAIVGMLGLFVRDLLLINRSDFGSDLDSFYLVMMFPMLAVSIFTVPLADILTGYLHRTRDRHSVQSLLDTASLFSLLGLGLVCSGFFVAAPPIYKYFTGDANIEPTIRLLPFALLLLFFSGPTLIANRLLNAFDKAPVSAIAQLIVPLVAVAAAFFAPDSRLLVAVAVGMVVGQLLNLVVLWLLAHRLGYKLFFPFTLGRLNGSAAMFGSYGSLVIVALLMSCSIPLNYWLAGRLTEGSISVWAVGSKLVQIASAVWVTTLTAVWLPYFSNLINAGLSMRIRRDIYLVLLVGSWSGGALALVVIAFVEPLMSSFMPAIQDSERIIQLTGVIQIAALQLPLITVGSVLLKISSVSAVSWKVVAATLLGVVANAALGYYWLEAWGVLSIAAAWSLGTLTTTMVIMFVTRGHTLLGWFDLVALVASWFVIGIFAIAITTASAFVGVSAALILVVVLMLQIKILLGFRNAPEIVIG